jgi:hypothetical protein
MKVTGSGAERKEFGVIKIHLVGYVMNAIDKLW